MTSLDPLTSFPRRAAGGAVWLIATGLVARLAGLVGTVAITHYLAPSVLGEVTAATVLALTANWMSLVGLNQYVVGKSHENEDALFHVTVLHLVFGAAAMLAVLMFKDQLALFLRAPNLAEYLPGMVLVVSIRRFASIPNKLLVRDMRFKLTAIASAVGELFYIGIAIALVVSTRLGGHAIVIANIAQALVVASIEINAAGFSRWLSPKSWNWQRVREILRFGVPLGIGTILAEAGRTWDKLIFSRLFGPHATGMYSLSYNLSDIPGIFVGERVAEVLFPTLVRLSPKERDVLFCRACGLLLLVTLPMAVGLVSTADTLVKLVLSPEWQGVAGFLLVLPTIAIFRPLNSACSTLMLAGDRTKTLMMIEALKVAVIFGGVWLLSDFGEVAASGGIVLAMLAQTAAFMALVMTSTFPKRLLWSECRGPILAVVVIPVTVFPVRALFADSPDRLLLQLFTEISSGAAGYCVGTMLFARSTLTRMIDILKRQRRGNSG